MTAIQDAIAAIERELMTCAHCADLRAALDALQPIAGGKVEKSQCAGKRGPGRPRKTRRKFPRSSPPAAPKPRRTWSPERRAKQLATLAGKRAQAGKPEPAVARDPIIVQRDRAILLHLRKGEATDAVLRAVLPREDGQTDDARSQALANSLTRLAAKAQIRKTETGWRLA